MTNDNALNEDYMMEVGTYLPPASEWVVIEELGTFQKPEENNK